jgi:transposase
MEALELTVWQRHRLEEQLKHAETARLFRRTLAVLEAGRGKSVGEIAESLSVSRQSVYNWIDAYRRGHDPTALWEGRHSGRPSLWDEENEAVLQCLLERRPEECGYYAVNWTAPLLQTQLEGIAGKSFSQDSIREALRRLGYVWKRGRYELAPDPELEKKTPDSPSDRQFAAPERVVGGG